MFTESTVKSRVTVRPGKLPDLLLPNNLGAAFEVCALPQDLHLHPTHVLTPRDPRRRRHRSCRCSSTRPPSGSTSSSVKARM